MLLDAAFVGSSPFLEYKLPIRFQCFGFLGDLLKTDRIIQGKEKCKYFKPDEREFSFLSALSVNPLATKAIKMGMEITNNNILLCR